MAASSSQRLKDSNIERHPRRWGAGYVVCVCGASAGSLTTGNRCVIIASSVGTVFEWYDFYLYGSLAAIIARQFFSALNPTSGFIFALLAFAAGFAVRPFGAIIFGSLGDLVGRKHTFLITIVIMGSSAFLVGVVPGYGSIGVAAPICLIALRLLQGVALGGEYGGAATYVRRARTAGEARPLHELHPDHRVRPLSDRIGRKVVVLAGCTIAALTYT